MNIKRRLGRVRGVGVFHVVLSVLGQRCQSVGSGVLGEFFFVGTGAMMEGIVFG